MGGTDEVKQSWEKFLNPTSLKTNIITIALFIAAYEMFEDQVIERPRQFFSTGFNENGLIIGEDYAREVLSRSKSRLHASLLWLRRMEAIEDDDINLFFTIRDHRNELTHEMIAYLGNASKEVSLDKFGDMLALLNKIEKWWIINIEAAVNPEFFPNEVDTDEIIPGTILGLRLIMDIVLGTEPEEGYYFKEFKKRFP